MNFLSKVQEKIDKHLSLRRLVYVILILSIVLLMNLTWPLWSFIYSNVKTILMPFIIGFTIAFLLRPIVKFFERYGVKRALSVPITFVFIFLGIWWLSSSIFPSIYNDLSKLVNIVIEGFQNLYEYYVGNAEATSPIIDSLYNQVLAYLNGLVSALPTLPSLVSNLFSRIIGIITTTMFSLIIGIYIIMDYEKFSSSTLSMAEKISPKLRLSLIVINRSVSSYLRTLVVLMGITFVEYGIFYFAVGHDFALVMAIISAISLLIPYIGGIIANIIGFLTGLNLSYMRLFLLFLGIMILPNIDGYVISPMVYSKRNKIDPLWSLLTFFAASTLFGFIGILLSMPIYFGVRSVMQLRANDWVIED